MAIRKSIEETLVVVGTRDDVLRRCEKGLSAQGFTAVKSNAVLYQIEGKFHKAFVWGEILITLLPEGDNTRIVAKATANVDNVYTLFSSPTKKIHAAFKAGFSNS